MNFPPNKYDLIRKEGKEILVEALNCGFFELKGMFVSLSDRQLEQIIENAFDGY